MCDVCHVRDVYLLSMCDVDNFRNMFMTIFRSSSIRYKSQLPLTESFDAQPPNRADTYIHLDGDSVDVLVDEYSCEIYLG